MGSQTWRIDPAPVPLIDSNVTVRWGLPDFGQCVQNNAPAQADVAAAVSQIEVWEKKLAGGDVALLLLNRGDAPHVNISVRFADIPSLAGNASNGTAFLVRDVWVTDDKG